MELDNRFLVRLNEAELLYKKNLYTHERAAKPAPALPRLALVADGTWCFHPEFTALMAALRQAFPQDRVPAAPFEGKLSYTFLELLPHGGNLATHSGYDLSQALTALDAYLQEMPPFDLIFSHVCPELTGVDLLGYPTQNIHAVNALRHRMANDPALCQRDPNAKESFTHRLPLVRHCAPMHKTLQPILDRFWHAPYACLSMDAMHLETIFPNAQKQIVATWSRTMAIPPAADAL